MKFNLLFLIVQLSSFWLHAQDSTIRDEAFELMLDKTLSHTVEEIDPAEAAERSAVWLDARERAEFDVSRIKGAKWVGYDDFDIKRVSELDKSDEIIVYCSIGYRSEKIAEKLKKKGFKNVKNLYGGIFSWVNNDMKVYDSLENHTLNIHAYDKLWGVWLQKGNKVY